MPKISPRNGAAARSGATKYDAHHKVLAQTYGAFADLRRELSDSKETVGGREEILRNFAACPDSQRAWLLLEDYFEKLSLSRGDFPDTSWWPRLLNAQGRTRLEELAFLFLRAKRPVPPELQVHASPERFARAEEAEQETRLVEALEKWLAPPSLPLLDVPRATLRVVCRPQPHPAEPFRHRLAVEFLLSRPRTGQKPRHIRDLIDLVVRATHEQELFAPRDWEFIQWLADAHRHRDDGDDLVILSDVELLQWLARWGQTDRLEFDDGRSLQFRGQMLTVVPHLENGDKELSFTHRFALPNGVFHSIAEARFFNHHPPLALVGNAFYLLRDAPPPPVMKYLAHRPSVPVRKLSHRLLLHLRKTQSRDGVDWEQLCVTHKAAPQFLFELAEDTLRLRLLAKSQRDSSVWCWDGREWIRNGERKHGAGKPELLDDPRLWQAVQWLRKLDWFTPEPGLWVGDANENFLVALAEAWASRPEDSEFLGNAAFHRLFLAPRQLKPRLIVKGSGIDWLSVSAEWEAEGLKLSKADLERLASATGRFVKLPNSGWIELDTAAVQGAHEAMAEMGVEGLVLVPQKVGMENVAHLAENEFSRFADSSEARELRRRVSEFQGIPNAELPRALRAELRPYQKDGFDFLAHLVRIKLGGILADDMGLGKTLQTLTWLAWLKEGAARNQHPKPSLVICPASVLHNWRREAEKFTPGLKVLVLESGAARHNLRRQIPQHDLIVTNYALLRRDLEELQKFAFRAVILDEAQFIKNPGALVTHSVKQLECDHKLALTGTPLENRLLDLWSIVDFIQPGYLGSQEQFLETYEPRGQGVENAQRIARKRLSAKLRPLLLRRLKKHVAKDLPDRIEERRDCPVGDEQRKLYLAELRRSREQVMKAVEQQGLNKSKMHILAALTRLRQICCHPSLVGSDAPSGKTETLFELLDPLIADGQKVLVFSQFVQMLQLLEKECAARAIPTHVLTGQTKARQDVVNAFQTDTKPGVFLLSLRAAGTGLNLTNASYVVLYDPWWNPAVEAQAIDRSHRIGQTHTVNAYRLIAPGTVEEKIWELQQNKAQTIADVLGEEGFAHSLTATDLEYLFAED
ncbi:MAG: DEAD/DEAH box helicase [Verrucomicrobia bacterium]|nr:DEAD/DEAH box helicase [Verrucomicrobiota bacterium]MDE3099167.1 DEAD/DEAH box helicase [Verrucomicrobiota bacterium]